MTIARQDRLHKILTEAAEHRARASELLVIVEGVYAEEGAHAKPMARVAAMRGAAEVVQGYLLELAACYRPCIIGAGELAATNGGDA